MTLKVLMARVTVTKRQIYSASSIYETKYSRMDPVKLVEDSF